MKKVMLSQVRLLSNIMVVLMVSGNSLWLEIQISVLWDVVLKDLVRKVHRLLKESQLVLSLIMLMVLQTLWHSKIHLIKLDKFKLDYWDSEIHGVNLSGMDHGLERVQKCRSIVKWSLVTYKLFLQMSNLI